VGLGLFSVCDDEGVSSSPCSDRQKEAAAQLDCNVKASFYLSLDIALTINFCSSLSLVQAA